MICANHRSRRNPNLTYLIMDVPLLTRKQPKFDFDVAISYAGEDRSVAQQLAKALKTKGLSVFYDVDYRSHLWGRKQGEFEKIYGKASRFVIPIVSSHYVKKDWCQLEFGIAKDEAKKRKEEFLLPIRLDDTRLLGLHDDTIHLDLRHISIPEIVRHLLNKLPKFPAKSRQKLSSKKPRAYRILHQRKHKLLGIIAVSPFPFNVQQFATIFPQIDWKKEIRFFRRNGFLKKGRGPLCIPKSVRREVLSDPHETDTFYKAWIEALVPIKSHTDTAIYLALQYLALKSFDEAFAVLADIAEGMEPDWWNTIYYSIFKVMYDKGLFRRIVPESRVRFHNAIGLCLSRIGRNEEAVESFLRLRRCSKRSNNSWGIGQSYINCGVAYYQIGSIEKAKRCYRKAIDHARKTNDNVLLGRSLHNLAMTLMDENPDKAMQLLEESLAVKELGHDLDGILGSMIGYGNVAASRGAFFQAIKSYRKAEKKARSLDFRHLRSLALSNLGSAHVDLGKFQEAFKFYQTARRIAEEEAYQDVLILCIQGEAIARLRAEEFRCAEVLFRELYELNKRTRNQLGMISALHDVGISLIKQRKNTEACRVLGHALRLARRADSPEWIYRCRLNSAFSYGEKADVNAIRKSAYKEEKAGFHVVAARLWEVCANTLLERNEKSDEIEKAFHKSIECFKKASNANHDMVRVYKSLYIWQRKKGSLEIAIDILNEIERIADLNHDVKEQIQGINERGICLQALGKFVEAEKAHMRALKLARSLRFSECIEISLNNLGELFRNTGREEKAVEIFIEAERMAQSRQAVESGISIGHNRALALSQLGKSKESEKLLRTCRDGAKRHKLWYEYIRALHGLANLAWLRGNDRSAERWYAKALAEANKQETIEMKCAISLNYSRLLRTKNRSIQGLQLLEPLKDDFEKFADSYLYYTTLAELYEDVKDLISARNNWERSKQTAMHADKRDMVALCSAALAEIYNKENKLQLSDGELESAFQAEDDPEGKALILLQRVDVLLAAKNEMLAEKVFHTACSLADAHGFNEIYIDLHMRIGDYYWGKGSRSQFNGMQAYIAVLPKALQIDFDTFVKVGAHAIGRLFSIENSKRIKRIDILHKRLSEWISKQIEISEAGDIAKWLLWPVRSARELCLTLQQGRTLSDQTITDILDNEFTGLFGELREMRAGRKSGTSYGPPVNGKLTNNKTA